MLAAAGNAIPVFQQLSKQMEKTENDSLIRLARDTVDLVILRRLVEQTEKRKPSPSTQQQLDRLTRARDLLDGPA
jgi:hypothetical protein